MKQLHTDFSPKSIRNGECRGDVALPRPARGTGRRRNTVVCSWESVRLSKRVSTATTRYSLIFNRAYGWQSVESRGCRWWWKICNGRKQKRKRNWWYLKMTWMLGNAMSWLFLPKKKNLKRNCPLSGRNRQTSRENCRWLTVFRLQRDMDTI